MELENFSIPATNRFASLYLAQKSPVKDFFHYDITDASVFHKRVEDLKKRAFNREGLADCIGHYMEKFGISPETARSLEKLRQPDAAVVIGGQQAGLLTGPLYTIHKLISIIRLASEQEEALQIPVVPVFWIAGEDHDYLEVNHIYAEQERRLKKFSYAEGPLEKKMISDTKPDPAHLKKWIHKVFEAFGETEHTNALLSRLEAFADRAQSLSDLFACMIHDLFKAYGVLLIDSADAHLRKIEAPFFERMIRDYDTITEAVLWQQQEIARFEFPKAIDISSRALNLFYYDGKERILLAYSPEHGGFTGKGGIPFFTEEALLALCAKSPERLSNNVVTRPLMQEWLFPTLAFIGGPGEIAYWAELKRVFEELGILMPPLVPRLNITLLERAVQRDIEELELDIGHVLKYGTWKEREKYWNAAKDENMDALIAETEKMLKMQYDKIFAAIGKGLQPLARKNLDFHLGQLAFLQRKVDEEIAGKHDAVLEKYARVERALRPDGNPQERVWNLFYFLNKYGTDFIHTLAALPFAFDGTHKLVKI
ncbi:bacillithiol biosynthesis cysteine-adding enzyme BshC [Heyndrickxia coagulans]|uniref:bacillithiol biosynthesis cysteine-adding enzyme BshC n=1 Tax=Heyndrickxia coagulans TaxID=1398 RepID=UPI002E1ACF89|nr:bacillithiol biosynthesis cysteine-adding enzyme BshC [Heyndrickxia coagulans]MED4966574.1 bacillithiol biosynthesis cysteine-adding enzyme BshC [Heyndrickxia coagulans]